MAEERILPATELFGGASVVETGSINKRGTRLHEDRGIRLVLDTEISDLKVLIHLL